MIPVKPLGHHVLIEIIPVNFKSTGGIILNTETETERERKGRDLAKIVDIETETVAGVTPIDFPFCVKLAPDGVLSILIGTMTLSRPATHASFRANCPSIWCARRSRPRCLACAAHTPRLSIHRPPRARARA